MKKLLRFIITIAIIIGIVFGIKYLVDRNEGNKDVYIKLSSDNAIEKIGSSKAEEGLDKLFSFVAEEKNQISIPDSVKESLAENGEFNTLRKLAQKQDDIFNYFYQKSALVTKQTKDFKNAVMTKYEEAKNKVSALHNSIVSLTDNYLDKVESPNKADLEYIFNNMVDSYKDYINSISELNYQLDKLVLIDYYDGNKIDIQYIVNDLSAQVMYAKTANETSNADLINILNNVDSISSLSAEEQQKLVVAMSETTNLLGYLQSKDKAEFLKNYEQTKSSYEFIGNIIYKVGA